MFNVDISKRTETSDFDHVNEKWIVSEFKIYPEEEITCIEKAGFFSYHTYAAEQYICWHEAALHV